MRKLLSVTQLQLLFCMVVLPWMATLPAGTTVWSGGNQNSDVVDNNLLVISGTNTITKPHLHIANLTTDLVVSVTHDSIVTSSLQLHLYAAAGHSITFSLQNDLLFSGSQSDFLITFSGEGELIFLLRGDNATTGQDLRLSFSSLPGNGHTFFFNAMNNAPNTGLVRFSRYPLGSPAAGNLNRNPRVIIGSGSMISFMSLNPVSTGAAALANDNGLIQFDASNLPGNYGRLILEISDKAGFIIGGNQVNANAFGTLGASLTDVNMSVPAGQLAQVELVNSNAGLGAWDGLLINNQNLTWSQLVINPFCETTISSTRTGFVLSANAALNLDNSTYLDYVVSVSNVTVTPNIPANVLDERPINSVIKDRNPAALIVDGNTNANAVPAQINLSGRSAIYFRAGADADGVAVEMVYDPVVTDTVVSFTIAARENFPDQGSIVFDVEGLLNVNSVSPVFTLVSGIPVANNVLNVFSLHMSPSGGSVLIEDSSILFPLRDFRTNADGSLMQYASGAFMINNRMNLNGVQIQHTDVNHAVYDKNIVAQSAPTYVGGDRPSFAIEGIAGCPGSSENTIAFFNANFLLNESAALTGVDLLVTNTPGGNDSNFIMYQNGRCVDNGNGRDLILGTDVGSTASDGAEIVNRDVYLNVFQTSAAAGGAADSPVLTFTAAPNNGKVTQGIPVGQNIANQYSVQSVFLGNRSNISVGTDLATNPSFALTTFPLLSIAGDFFAFETQGGTLNAPDLSMTTGEGGMFIDTNGTVTIQPNLRAVFGMMVTKSGNGTINLPKNSVLFEPRVGIAQWQLNLNDPSQLVIVGAGQTLSDYTMDWQATRKEYCSTPPAFVPYELQGTPVAGASPAVVAANLTGLPTVYGEIDQMQIVNSRLGDQANLLVSGGLIRELLLLTGNASAVAPVGILVVENNGTVGLGTASRNVDSLDASVMLGINGLTIIANGNGRITLNENALINNVCHILSGTGFGIAADGVTPEAQRLLIDSVVPHELRVKSDGVLDITQFTNTNQTLEITGKVNVVLEPGARVLMGGGNLVFSGNATLVCEPYTNISSTANTLTSDTNDYRAKFIGSGFVTFKENSQMSVFRGAYVGIETDPSLNLTVSSQSWGLTDAAKLYIGSEEEYGGVFQVGNATASASSNLISFTLVLNGIDALVDVNSQGMLGLGVGIVNKPATAPNTWTVNTLNDVQGVTINVTQGVFRNNQTYSGDNKLAGLFAIGSGSNTLAPVYNFSFNTLNSEILGGGNMVLVTPTGGAAVAPTVLTTSGVVTPGRLSAGIMSSRPMLLDSAKSTSQGGPAVRSGSDFSTISVSNLSASALFGYLIMLNYQQQISGRLATFALDQLGQNIAGFVNSGIINRNRVFDDIATGNATEFNALEIGAIGISLAGLNPVYSAVQA